MPAELQEGGRCHTRLSRGRGNKVAGDVFPAEYSQFSHGPELTPVRTCHKNTATTSALDGHSVRLDPAGVPMPTWRMYPEEVHKVS